MQYFGYKSLAALCFMTFIVFFVSTHYLDTQQKKFSKGILNQLEVQEAKTYELAQSVKNSKLTPPLSEFINDCSTKHRNQFDANLDKLATLSIVQIESLEPLFDACADYFANVKAALVFQLEEKIAEMETLVTLANINDQTNTLKVPLSSWKSYLALEKQLAVALREQVVSQEKIMVLLKEGKSVSDAEVQNLVVAARELSQSASVTTKQLDAVFLTLGQ